MADEFKLGDVVQLKSGGPQMTVSHLYTTTKQERRAQCEWFVDGKKQYDNFPVSSLQHPKGPVAI